MTNVNRHRLKYILDDDKNVVSTSELFVWAEWYENADRRVAEDTIGEYWVSTVFLGLDHRFDDEGPPLIFETMIKHKIDGWMNYQNRYATWEEALKGHNEAVEWVKNGCNEDEL